MQPQPETPQTLFLTGEVAEILDQGAERRVKVALGGPGIVDVVVPSSQELRLGDRVRIDAHMKVERVTRLLDTNGRTP